MDHSPSAPRGCRACGRANARMRRFCGGCGAHLVAPCTTCGSENEWEDRFCGACGHQMAERRAVVVEPPAPIVERRHPTLPPPVAASGRAARLLELNQTKFASGAAPPPPRPDKDGTLGQADIDRLFAMAVDEKR